jgi:hypothetical protein
MSELSIDDMRSGSTCAAPAIVDHESADIRVTWLLWVQTGSSWPSLSALFGQQHHDCTARVPLDRRIAGAMALSRADYAQLPDTEQAEAMAVHMHANGHECCPQI